MARLWQLVEPCQHLSATLTNHGLPLAAAADVLKQMIPAADDSNLAPPCSSFSIPSPLQNELLGQLQGILTTLQQALLPEALKAQLQQIVGTEACGSVHVNQEQEEELRARQRECQSAYAKELEEHQKLTPDQQLQQQEPFQSFLRCQQQSMQVKAAAHGHQAVGSRDQEEKPRAASAGGAASYPSCAAGGVLQHPVQETRVLSVATEVGGKERVLGKRNRSPSGDIVLEEPGPRPNGRQRDGIAMAAASAAAAAAAAAAAWRYEGPMFSKQQLECISSYPKDCIEQVDQEDLLQLVLLALWFKLVIDQQRLQHKQDKRWFGWGDPRWYVSGLWIPADSYPESIGLLEHRGMDVVSYLSTRKAPALSLSSFTTKKRSGVLYVNITPVHDFVRTLGGGTYFAKRMALLTNRARQLVLGEQGYATVSGLVREGTPEALYAQVSWMGQLVAMVQALFAVSFHVCIVESRYEV
jgi:hypothetical protein